uniref:Cytochrome b5 heme-binding domain-containing protein n=1 Tax=Globodera pallida TaxID=36090 RepID=A0A183CSZ3_GLOPA
FNDVGHSNDAKELTEIIEEAKREGETESWRNILTSPTWSNLLIPVALSIGVFCAYKFGTALYRQMISSP